MESDEREVCICFHVPLGKLVKYYQLHHPKVASQLSDCYGAGTGCGWCVPHLQKIYEQLEQGKKPQMEMSDEEYLRRRLEYRTNRRSDPAPPGKDLDPGNTDEGCIRSRE